MNEARKSLTLYGGLSIAAALVTIALKAYAYWVTGSVGLLSDALESLINLAAGVIVLTALSIAARPPDESHAYGHEKIEYFSSGAEGVLILLAACGIAFTAWQRLLHPQPLQQLDLGIAVSVIAALINLLVARILIAVGRRHRSITLEADGRHLMTDVWTTGGVVFGIGLIAVANRLECSMEAARRLGMNGWEILDPIIAFLVALQIIWTGLQLIRRTVSGLMDSALSAGDQAQIIAVLDAFVVSHGIAYHALRTRYAGARRFMSVHVLVPGEWTVQRGHDLLEEIERQMMEKFGNIDFDTHLEPIEDRASWEHNNDSRFPS